MTQRVTGGPGARLGSWGEEQTAEYLKALGWQVLERNWRCPSGEIDLVALEPLIGAPPIGVAVEVKCRSGHGFGDPLESITYAKQRRLNQLAAAWRRSYPGELSGLRVDAVGIIRRRGLRPELRHVRGLA